jgi:hypothetical protein
VIVNRRNDSRTTGKGSEGIGSLQDREGMIKAKLTPYPVDVRTRSTLGCFSSASAAASLRAVAMSSSAGRSGTHDFLKKELPR